MIFLDEWKCLVNKVIKYLVIEYEKGKIEINIYFNRGE